MTDSKNTQKQHFENLASEYESHYFDKWSLAYRKEFIYPALWGNLDLNGKDVAELACGSGHNSLVLKEAFPSARLEGYDISPTACRRYTQLVGAKAHEIDLTTQMPEIKQYDAALVVGGLHHCVADLETTLANVASMLRPGGIFMMLEPSNRHFLESLRQIWYKMDKKFDDENEAALDHDEILDIGRKWFDLKRVSYFGGPAFFFVLNSMILRVPLSAKPFTSPPLMVIERLWNAVPIKQLHNVFAAQWQRRP